MIKIFFLVVIAMLVLAMTSGMNILRGAKFFDWRKMKMEADFIRYKRALAAESKTKPNPEAAETRSAKSISVLLYHGVITDPNWKADDTNISLSSFADQMFELKRSGYKTVTFQEFFDFMKNGKELPEKSFLLTFDDGRKDSYYPVDPILKALGYNAVMFVITGNSLDSKTGENDFYLARYELQEMKKNGRWEIESHGDFDHDWEQISQDGQKGHFLSNRLWISGENRNETAEEAKKRILKDLADSKMKLEKVLREKVFGFAYPFNDFGQEAVNFPEAATFLKENIGSLYPLAFIQTPSDEETGNFSGANNLFVKRIDVNEGLKSSDLAGILGRSGEKTLPFSDSFWDDRGWKVRWGNIKIWGDLTLSESEARGGNLTILLGSTLWKDYIARTWTEIVQGDSVSQIVRYRDDDNYAACNFSKSELSLSEKIDGRENILAEKPGDFSADLASNPEIAAGVSGNLVRCYLDGNPEIEANISPKLDSGGVGFYIWDDLAENAVVRIKKVDVEPI